MSDDKKTKSDKQIDGSKLKDDKKVKAAKSTDDKKTNAVAEKKTSAKKIDKKTDAVVEKKVDDKKADKKADAAVEKKTSAKKIDKKADAVVEKKVDDKKTDKQTDVKAEEKPLAEVIPFRTDHDTTKGIEDTQSKENVMLESEVQIELDEVVSNIKNAFKEMKEKFAPIREGVNDIVVTVRESGKEAVKKEREARQSAEEKAAHSAESDTQKDDSETKKDVEPAVKAAKETAEVISLAMERLKRRGIEHRIDLKEILSKQFDGFVDKRIELDEMQKDEDGRPIVKVDADFVKQHGTEVVPAILGGVTQSIISTLFGDIFKIGQDDDKKADDSNTEQEGADVVDHDAHASDEPKYRVQFDFATLVSNFMKSAKLAPSENLPHSKEEDRKARKTIIEGARIFEDALNGKEFKEGETQQRLDAAIADDDEEITPIDEKHARILKLTKQFEESLNPENDEKPKK